MRGEFFRACHVRRAAERLRMDSGIAEVFPHDRCGRKSGERTGRGILFARDAGYCREEAWQALTGNSFCRPKLVKGYGKSVYAGSRYFADLAVLQPGQKKELPEGYSEADVPLPC